MSMHGQISMSFWGQPWSVFYKMEGRLTVLALMNGHYAVSVRGTITSLWSADRSRQLGMSSNEVNWDKDVVQN